MRRSALWETAVGDIEGLVEEGEQEYWVPEDKSVKTSPEETSPEETW